MEGKAPKKKSYSTILEDPVNKFVKEALSKFIQYCRGKNYTPRQRNLYSIPWFVCNSCNTIFWCRIRNPWYASRSNLICFDG